MSIPMTLAQQGVWFTERAGGDPSAYLVAVALTVAGPAPVDDAWHAVVRRHPVLASTVAETDGSPRLVPAEPPPVEHATIPAALSLPDGRLARCVAQRLDDGCTVVLVVAHHLVLDGGGKDVLVADLADALAGKDIGVAGDLGAAVRAQNDRIAAALPAARDFWSSRPTAGEVILPGLTTAVATAEPATTIPFDVDLAAVRATRFEVLLAGVHVLLARYGNTVTSVAVDLSTRSADTARELGMWVNELPVTVAVSPDMSFADVVRAVRAEARAVYRHREVPLGRARPGLPPRPAMAPVSISYRRLAGTPHTVEWLLAPPAVRSALHLLLVDGPAGLTGRLQAPARMGAAGVSRIAGHLRALLAAALAGPDRPVGDLDFLAPAELSLLERMNATDRPRPATTVLDLVRSAARRTPDAVAVSAGDGTLTYRELVAAAHRIGNGLRRQGAASGDVVGLRARRGAGLVTGMLGILASGAAYLPLDPTYPASRLEFIAADAGAKLILGDDHASGSTAPPTTSEPDGLAYVIYTSGSTGRPKGVEIGHAALANLVAAMGELIGADPADRWLNLTTISFDISALEILAPLTTGGRVVVAPDAAVREGAALARLIRDAGITHVQATPSTWQLLLDAGWAGAPITALSGGEALPLALARRLRPLVDRLINVYGPTETTIWSTAAEMPAEPDRVTIGRPLANTTLHVVDDRLRPVPVGVPGELCIGGAGLARGYRGRPDLTAAKFVTAPDGRRWYRTGDQVRLAADGLVEFLGRADDQIKLRGHRIELGEIEQTLLGAPGVEQAAVAVRDGELAAYLVGAGDLPAIRAHVAARLPRHMIPRDVVRLDRLPRTLNGKLDRAALPSPVPVPAEPSAAGGLTEIVTGIWREVLRVDEIPAGATLFDLGGHSLTIMQITARIRKALGAEVPFDVFFDTPTIDGVVAAVEEELA